MRDPAIVALDGQPVAATLFPAAGREEPREVVVIACATATPQGFYRGFAEHARAMGRDVVTFDYRGIGKARPARLRGFQAGFLDFIEKDLAGVVEWASQFGPVDLVGHSLGGQALGLLPRPGRVRSLATFGTGVGHHSYMPRSERPKVLAVWWLLGPLLASIYGYLPGRRLGFGEDLPLQAYRDWRRWCLRPRYWFDDPAVDFAPRFAAVRSAVLSVSADDDRWAPHASADMFMSFYAGAEVEKRRLSPAERGLPRIGHMGFYRRDNGAALWPVVTDWWKSRGFGG